MRTVRSFLFSSLRAGVKIKSELLKSLYINVGLVTAFFWRTDEGLPPHRRPTGR